MEDTGLWKDFPTDKELGAGPIDVKAFKAESAQDVAARIRMVLQSVPPAQQKLRAMVEGARLVRQEIAGRGEPRSLYTETLFAEENGGTGVPATLSRPRR